MKLEERQFLFRKLIKKGFSPEKANERIKKMSTHLKSLVSKLRKQRMSERDINTEFKKEFAKLCQKI